MVADGMSGDLSSRLAEVAQKAASERTRFIQEIAMLQAAVEEARANASHSGQAVSTADELEKTVLLLRSKNQEVISPS